jgi:hypothetical protein
MNKEQAVSYLRFSGFSDEQVKAIEGAFTCDKCVYSTSEGCQYDDITETIPPFDKTGWIPVSERLPEKGVDCLVFVKGYDGCAYYEDDMVLLPDNRLHESGYCKHGECEKCEHASDVIYTDFQVCSYWGKDETTNMYHDGWNVMNELEEVIAWMPLPEPYKAEGSGEE